MLRRQFIKLATSLGITPFLAENKKPSIQEFYLKDRVQAKIQTNLNENTPETLIIKTGTVIHKIHDTVLPEFSYYKNPVEFRYMVVFDEPLTLVYKRENGEIDRISITKRWYYMHKNKCHASDILTKIS
ncbi:hypothetical protein LCGC14_1287560 [marine sediment metagenome]|uniref:Uncharacterized protein n=1 Tax=marine sediment metagenome TaxID=412755 RepID=A0A0F9LEC4_9ZZZZ